MVRISPTRLSQDSAGGTGFPRDLASSRESKAVPRGNSKSQYVIKRCAHSMMEVLSMKKVALLALFVAVIGAMASAQITSGNMNYVPTVDVMGAHENGGRGCAGCHAPHSGGRGSGGNIILGSSGATYTAAGVEEGDTGLWGTDTNPIETGNGGAITFDTSYPVSLAGLVWSSGALYTGVVTCLSCHDGNVSKGAMMSGQAYEQSFGLLNFATNVGSNHQAAPVNLYGSN